MQEPSRPQRNEDEEDEEDVLLDPDEERFLRGVENATGAFLRGLAIGVPLWIALLLAMSFAFRGPSLPGLAVATVATVVVVLLLERRRGGARGPRRISSRAMALLLAAALVVLVWTLFVLSASR